MSIFCGTAVNQVKSCDYTPIGGVADEVIILNKADVDAAIATGATKFLVNETNPLIVEVFGLTFAKKGYVFESDFQQIKPKIDVVVKAGAKKYKQSISFQVPKHDAIAGVTLSRLAKGEFVAIFANKWKNIVGGGKYKIFGLDGGLRLAAGTLTDPWSDNSGIYTVTLESKDNSLENFPCRILFKTSETVTDVIYTAFKTAAPSPG